MKKKLILILVAFIALNFAACRDTKNTETVIEEVTQEVQIEETNEIEVDSLSFEDEDIDLENHMEE